VKWRCVALNFYRSEHYWTFAKNDMDNIWLNLNCITTTGTCAKMIGDKPNVTGLRNVRFIVFERC
jgi:hypothetical protein